MAYSHSEPGFGGKQSLIVPYPNPYVTQPQRRDAEDAEAGEEYFLRVLVSGVFQQLLWSDPQSQSKSFTLQVMSDVAPFSRRLGASALKLPSVPSLRADQGPYPQAGMPVLLL